MFFKKGDLKKFTKLTRKHLYWNLFFNKVTCHRPVKRRLQHSCFPVNFAKFLRIRSFLSVKILN